MVQRGRKSAAAVSVAGLGAPIGSASRLQAPLHLSDAERAIWIEMVNDQPASAFTPTHSPMMEIYCRHIVQSRILADELMNFDRTWLARDDGLKRYDKLLAMSEREGRAASSIATRLRITRQAIDQQTVARSNNNASKSRKPWELALDQE